MDERSFIRNKLSTDPWEYIQLRDKRKKRKQRKRLTSGEKNKTGKLSIREQTVGNFWREGSPTVLNINCGEIK